MKICFFDQLLEENNNPLGEELITSLQERLISMGESFDHKPLRDLPQYIEDYDLAIVHPEITIDPAIYGPMEKFTRPILIVSGTSVKTIFAKKYLGEYPNIKYGTLNSEDFMRFIQDNS